MAILKTRRSKWIVGSIVLIAMVLGTLFGLPSGGKSHSLPLTMDSMSAAPYFAPVTPSGVVPQIWVRCLISTRPFEMELAG